MKTMFRVFRICFALIVLFMLFLSLRVKAQTPAPATALLHEIHAEGLKSLTPDQVTVMSQLSLNTQVGKADLQTAADRLLKTGMFAKVNYSFKTVGEDLSVTFQLEESPRVPIYFDNFPWFADSELNDAIRAKIPYFDGTLPEGGAVVDEATDAVKELLASHKLNVTIEHLLLAAPLAEGNVQQFHAEGASFSIASVEFGDPSLSANHIVQQELASVRGKPYSRMTIDLFLAEQLRPIYLQQGYVRAKLGPPEVRLTGNPNQKLPDKIPVFIPVDPGGVYHWKSAEISGNSTLSSITLANEIALKPGDVANGMEIEAGLDRMREEYGHLGFLDAKIDSTPVYDDAAHTISYAVAVSEGVQYRFHQVVLTGLSLNGERRLNQMWPTQAGAVFDKAAYEKFLTKLQSHPAEIFGDLPLHYDSVGHWLRTDPENHAVDVLLDFK
jgi:outer membrane protein assembly factor BamA